MNSVLNHLRLFFSVLLFVSNALTVLHLHEFFPASHIQISSQDLDLHRVVQEEILCPLHYIAQGDEPIFSPKELIFESTEVYYILIDHEVDVTAFVSGESCRAPPSIA